MASFLLTLTFIFEIVSTIISFLTGYLLIKHNKEKQIGNMLLAFGIILIGFFTIFTLIYSIIAKAWAIILFLKFGMIAILFGVTLLILTMKVLIHSSLWIKKLEKWIYISLTLILSIIMAATGYITVNDEINSVTSFNPFVFYPFALYILLMLIYGSFSIYEFGIKRNEGNTKKRMVYFFSGLIILIFALITDSIGNFFPELELIFDLILFSSITIAMILLARVFLLKQKNQNEN
ncbi:MAG: hypothetical protein ACTSYY_04075 [Promethearchaeota archaeon]